MEVNNTNPLYIRAQAPVNKNNTVQSAYYQGSPSQYQYQYYHYPAYSTQIPATDINASMKSQVLRPSQEGYRKIQVFNAPFLGEGNLYQLDNGQKVVIIPKKGPTTIKTFVKVGSFNEAKNRGISHYIEHNLFNGSSHLKPNEFVEKVVSMGGQYNASTNTTNTDYFINSPLHKEKDFDTFIKMHADMLQNPLFTEKMLDKEKGPVISEIQMYEDDPSDKAFNLMVKNLFGIKCDYQGLIAGSSKTIANLTRQDVVNYYNEWYRPDNMTTVVVGEVNPDQAVKTISKLFNQKQAPPVSSTEHYYEPLNLTQKPVRTDFKSPQTDTVILNMAFAGPKNNEMKDTLATLALCTALTGYENARLSKTFKDFNTGGSLDINVISPKLDDPQLITLAAAFSPGQEEEGLKAVYKTVQNLAIQPLTNDEMSIVKNRIKDNFIQISESSMGVANLIGQAITDHGTLNAYTNILDEVEKLTPQDLQQAARTYLDLNKTSIVMVHPESQKIGSNSAPVNKELGFKGNNDRFKIQNVKEYELPNNLYVAINDDPASIRTSTNLSVKTDDIKTIKPGVIGILSGMLNKGTKNYSTEQLQDIIDTHNLGIGASASGSSIDLEANCAKEKLPMALGIMKEMLYNPDLTQEKFNKAKEELKVGLSSLSKDPSDRAMEILFPEFNAGNTPRKILANIDKVTLDDVKNLHSQILSDSQGKISIDGPISKTPGLGQAVFTQLQSGMGFVKKYHKCPDIKSEPLTESRVITEIEPRNQADIVQIFKIKQNGNIKDTAALNVLNEILGGNSQSRLFSDLREAQKLAYRVKSIYSNYGEYGTVKLLIKTTTEDDLKGPTFGNVQKSLDGFKKHMNNLMTTPVNNEELETAKLEAKTKFINSTENSSGRASLVHDGLNTYYGVNHYNKMLDAIDSLTPQDIQNTANLYLNQPSIISMIASPNTINATKPYLSSLGKVEETKQAII